jgi:type I restriction enzyme, S subunit
MSATTKTLEELCDPIRGITYGIVKVGDFIKGGVPVIRGGDIRGNRIFFDDHKRVSEEVSNLHKRTILKGGEILTNLISEPGHTAIVPSDFAGFNVSRDVAVIPLIDDVSHSYVNYFLRSPMIKQWLEARLQGSVTQKINLSTLKELPVFLPPLPEQKAIAHILGSLDDKIKLNRWMNATLEGMAQALFKSWFVDFDPVIDNALVAGNPIPDKLAKRAEVRRQALANGTASREAANQFPAAFQLTEEMGWIPEGWEVKTLDEIADYRNGLALQKFRPNPGESPLPIVKIAQLKNGEATWDEVASPGIAPECIIHDGDVVFSWSGSLMIDLWCGGKAALNQHLFKVTSTDFPKWFYLSWSNEHLHNFQRIAADKAVTMGHIKRSHLSEAVCVIPDSILLTKGSEIINPYIEKIVSQRLQNRTLIKLRDTLLPKLISGAIRIPDAEKLTEEALV